MRSAEFVTPPQNPAFSFLRSAEFVTPPQNPAFSFPLNTLF
jgi:hypothetical protein